MKNIKIYWILVFALLCVYKDLNAQNLNVGVDSTLFKKAVSYHTLSDTYEKKSDFITAKKYLDSLYNLSKKHKLKDFELIGLVKLGVIYTNSGEFKKALKVYSNIIDLCEKLPKNNNVRQLHITAMQNMARIYVEVESYDKSVEILERALVLAEEFKENPFITGSILSNLASSYTLLKKFDKSISYQERVLTLAQNTKTDFLIIHSLLGLSENYNEKSNYKKALAYAKEAYTKNQIPKAKVQKQDWVFLRLGLAFKGLQQLDSAKYYLREAKKEAKSIKNNEVEIASVENLAKVYEALGDFKNAQESQKRFNELNTLKLEEKRVAAVATTKKEAATVLKNEKKKNKIKTTYIIVAGLVITSLLGGFLMLKNKQKKKTEEENKQLQADFKQVQSKYASLKESMLQLSNDKEQSQHIEKYKNSSLSNKDRVDYKNRILELMDKEKPYLNADLTKDQLASNLQMNAHHLSEVLALSFGQNFNNFINFYRVNKAQELLSKKEYKNYKIEAIGYEAGFNSKTSFNRVFKNITTTTPSEYRKEQLTLTVS